MNYSELLQLTKGWGNFVSDRINIWRLRYSGNDLHEQFRKEVNLIRPAIKAMLADTKKAVVEEASRRLLTALEEGAQSAKEKGWIMADEVEAGLEHD